MKSFMNVSLFDSIDDILYRIKLIEFELTYIIVSSTIIRQFINELKKIENEISISPKIIVYNSDFIINFDDIINDPFYNYGGVAFNISEIKTIINKKIYPFEPNLYDNFINDYPKDIEFTFQVIKNKSDLIGPTFISELILNPQESEFNIFDKYLMENFGD